MLDPYFCHCSIWHHSSINLQVRCVVGYFVVTVVLLLFNNETLSFLTVILLPLFGDVVDMDAANRVFGACEGALLPLPILFGRLELDDDVSEK